MKSFEMEGVNHNESAAVRAAITALVGNSEAMRRLYRAAGTYVRDAAAVRELVWDAIGDIQLGEVTCDLTRDVSSQLERQVRRRAKRVYRNTARVVFVPLDKAPAEALIADAESDDIGAEEYNGYDAAELVTRIRELAREDSAVLRLLGYYERGLITRRDVLSVGMTQWVYRAARERLVAYFDMAVDAGPVSDSAAIIAAAG